MSKRLSLLVLFLLSLLIWMTAFADESLYLGTVSKDMTIRKTKSTSGKKVGSVSEGEEIQIIEFGETWTKIEKDSTIGYVLSKNVTNLTRLNAAPDEENALYFGVTNKDLTLRAKKNKSAQRLMDIPAGETISITELGKDWMTVVKNGITCYLLSSGVGGIRSAREGIEVPEAYIPEPPFVAVYTAQADVNLTIRKKNSANSNQVGIVYEKESVEIMSQDDEWAYIRKNGVTGYVLVSHLRYYRRTDPYGPYIPGVVQWMYAALVTQNVDVYDEQSGAVIRTLHPGDVIAVSGLDERMSVRLPYQRTYGRIFSTAALNLEPVRAWDQAGPGELISVFSTYYPEVPSTASEEGRLYNIKVGIDRINDVRIRSGEEFRFNDYCAPYTKGNGYELGPIINFVSDKKTGYGGGICQVSTTLYDAVLQIPIEIVKQQVHSAYGIFYAPLDMDAAVGAGNLDLRLKNVLPYDVIMHLETQDGVLCVRIYRAPV